MSAPARFLSQSELEKRVQFEMLLADICTQFVNVAPSDIDSKIATAQRAICESLKVDQSTVWQVSEEDPDKPVMTHVYRDPNLRPLPSRPNVKDHFPWASSKILNKEIVCVPNTATLPSEAATDKESWEEYGIHSSLVIPLSVGGGPLIGVLAFSSMEEHDWPEPLQRRLQILAYVFAQALDRKDAERKVRESENRFRLVADTAPVLIWMSGADKLCTYFNRPWLDFTGRSMEGALGNGWSEGVHPEDLQNCLDTYTQSFDRREKFRMEYRLRRCDGEYRWILDIGVPRFNQDRSFAGYIGIGVDVTERKLADEARFRLAAIVESSEDAIASVTLDGVIVSWNAGAQHLYEYTPAEAIGKSFSIVIPPELADQKNEILETLRTGSRIEHFETTRVTKSGKRINASVSISPIKDSSGAIVGLSGIARDITERKQAEEALRQSEERFRLAALAGKMFAYEWNAATDVIVRSADFTQALGNNEPLETTGQQVLARIHPDERETVKAAIAALSPESPDLKISYRMVRRDGTLVWVERTSRAHFDEQGRMLRLVGMVVDVTERKRAEEALSDMTRKLVEAQEQERARIGRELHDDINQRLALLSIELERLRDNPSEVQNRVQQLLKHTSGISHDVQALSHELHSSKLEYLGVVAGLRGWCREFAERQNMEIEFKSDVTSVLPLEVGVCLLRVLQEAVHNAAKHSGVKRMGVQLAEYPNEVHLIVSDSGKGFDVAAATQGKGLGLTSMRERVRLVNGTISIESGPMGGTTIHVRVPF